MFILFYFLSHMFLFFFAVGCGGLPFCLLLFCSFVVLLFCCFQLLLFLLFAVVKCLFLFVFNLCCFCLCCCGAVVNVYIYCWQRFLLLFSTFVFVFFCRVRNRLLLSLPTFVIFEHHMHVNCFVWRDPLT